MVGNHILQLRSGVAVKLNLQPYIRRYTVRNENFEYSCPLILNTSSVSQIDLFKFKNSY